MTKYVIGVVAVVALVVGGLFVYQVARPPLGASSGTEHYNQENFYNGLTVGAQGNSAISAFSCTTASYTIPQLGPGYLGGTHFATTSVTLTGAALGDRIWVTNNSATNSLQFYGLVEHAEVSAANTVVVQFFNESNTTSTAVPTSTLKVCYWH